jgi:hypothetical protein
MRQVQPPPISSDVSPQRRWKWRCFVLTILYVGALLFFGYITLGFAPRYEKIFEEMLGDRSKLPAYTQLVVRVSRFIQGNAILLGPLLVFLMPILLWVFRGGKAVSIAVLLLIGLMMILAVAAIPALMVPHLQLIDSIGRED